MKNYLQLILSSLIVMISACSNGQSQTSATNLSATDFAEQLKQKPEATLVDVRTPEEFGKGHLKNAKNIDWNGNDFEK